jgi:GNAT superfamily N-acetyltransferase
MTEEFHLAYVDNPEESAWGIIGRGLGAYNERRAGESNFERLCFTLVGPDDEVVGGILAEIYWGWLYIDLLWVKKELRGQKYGHNLLTRVEEEARQHGAKFAYLDTFSFQVPEFYKQHGYDLFGELNDFPEGHTRYFFRKAL